MKNTILLLAAAFSLLLSGCSSDDGPEATLPEELDFTGTVIGCGDFSVSQFLNPENSNISLEIRGEGRESLGLSTESKAFSLLDSDIISSISIWDGPAGANFCNDVVMEGPELLEKWNAVSGTIHLSVSGIEETEFETFYRIIILLDNVVFENHEGKGQRVIENLRIKAGVGWSPG